MIRVLPVFVLALTLLPFMAAGSHAANEAPAPAAQTEPSAGVIETIKEKAGEALEATEEFLAPPPTDPALAGETTAQDIADAMHEGNEADHGSSSGLPQFDPTWFPSQLFWLFMAFAVMYLIFSRSTLPEISSTIDNRKNHIQSDLDQAEELTTQAEAVQSAYEQSLQGARDEASSTIADMHTAMQTRKNDESEAFRVKSEADIKAAEARLEAAKDKAMGEISDIVAEVAAQAVEKIIGVTTDTKDAKTIVNRLSDDKAAA